VLPIVATPVPALLHVLPVVVDVRVVVPPTHTDVVPEITPGTAPTVTAAIERQPADIV